MLHRSLAAEKETAAVTLYLDDSGSEDDPGTPNVILGGVLMEFSHFEHFEDAWDRMLDQHGIVPPLHMAEFGPSGRFSGMSACCRHELFLEVAELINSHKLFSIAAKMTNAEYKAILSKTIGRKFSVYGLCFNLAVMMNHKLAEANSYAGKIPFMMDAGHPDAEHVRQAHAFMLKEFQRDMFLHLGGLDFEDDRDFGVLQAADVIAWGVRRRASKKPFTYAFDPVEPVIAEANHHVEQSWEPAWLTQLGTALDRRIAEASK
jgi:hypothetical protein